MVLRNMGKGFVGLGLRMLIFAFAISSVAMFGKSMMYHAYTPDLPWILGGGRYILSHGHLPTHDIFSWTFPQKTWVLYQWLFEVVAAWLEQHLGLALLIRSFVLFVVALYVLIPIWIHRSKKVPLMFTLTIASAALFIAGINMSIRPMIMTSVFLLAQYMLLTRYREQKCTFKFVIIGLVITYMLWGNMHTGVTIGLFSLAFMALGDLLEKTGIYAFNPVDPSVEGRPAKLSHYSWFLATALLASLVNPYGWGIYPYLAHLSGEGYLNDVIVELQSPNFHYLNYIYFTGLLVLFMLLMSHMKRVFPAYATIHLLVFSVIMLFFQRFVVWTCLFYALMLPVALYHWWMAVGQTWTPFKNSVERFNIYLPLLLIVMVIASIIFIWMPDRKFQNYFQTHQGACEPFIKGINAYQSKLKQPGDRAFMLPEIGSCTLGMYPNEKVFMDTRFDFYGEHFTQEGRDAGQVKDGWQAFLGKWGINTVIMTPQWQLPFQLQQHDLFKPIYSDENLIILRKTKNLGNF